MCRFGYNGSNLTPREGGSRSRSGNMDVPPAAIGAEICNTPLRNCQILFLHPNAQFGRKRKQYGVWVVSLQQTYAQALQINMISKIDLDIRLFLTSAQLLEGLGDANGIPPSAQPYISFFSSITVVVPFSQNIPNVSSAACFLSTPINGVIVSNVALTGSAKTSEGGAIC